MPILSRTIDIEGMMQAVGVGAEATLEELSPGNFLLLLKISGKTPSSITLTSLVRGPRGGAPFNLELPQTLTPTTTSEVTTASFTFSDDIPAPSYIFWLTVPWTDASRTSTPFFQIAVPQAPGFQRPGPDEPSHIEIAATEPRRASGDNGSVERHSLPDQIAADEYARANRALRRNPLGIRHVKLVPPGMVDAHRRLCDE
jgi:hypothetical protein